MTQLFTVEIMRKVSVSRFDAKGKFIESVVELVPQRIADLPASTAQSYKERCAGNEVTIIPQDLIVPGQSRSSFSRPSSAGPRAARAEPEKRQASTPQTNQAPSSYADVVNAMLEG